MFLLHVLNMRYDSSKCRYTEHGYCKGVANVKDIVGSGTSVNIISELWRTIQLTK